jgi:hypothetical protein
LQPTRICYRSFKEAAENEKGALGGQAVLVVPNTVAAAYEAPCHGSAAQSWDRFLYHSSLSPCRCVGRRREGGRRGSVGGTVAFDVRDDWRDRGSPISFLHDLSLARTNFRPAPSVIGRRHAGHSRGRPKKRGSFLVTVAGERTMAAASTTGTFATAKRRMMLSRRCNRYASKKRRLVVNDLVVVDIVVVAPSHSPSLTRTLYTTVRTLWPAPCAWRLLARGTTPSRGRHEQQD